MDLGVQILPNLQVSLFMNSAICRLLNSVSHNSSFHVNRNGCCYFKQEPIHNVAELQFNDTDICIARIDRITICFSVRDARGACSQRLNQSCYTMKPAAVSHSY